MKSLRSKSRVAIIFGGIGPEHDVSVRSAEFFISALEKTEYLPIPVYISHAGAWRMFSPHHSPKKIAAGEAVGIPTYPVRLGCKSGFMFLGRVLDVFAAVPLIHGEGGEDGLVPSALSLAGIDYVGADNAASAISYNKAYTKTVAEALGIPTVPWIYLNRPPSEFDCDALIREVGSELGFPAFVKPATLGSSVGCRAVYSSAELMSAVCHAARLSGNLVVIEKMLDAPRELEVAYFHTGCNEMFTNPGEIHCQDGFYSFEEKYSENSGATVLSSARLASVDKELILEYSRALVSAIGIRHMCRIDFFMSDGLIYFNEINTVPGMTDTSLYPALLSGCGITPEKMVEELIAAAVMRNDRRV